MGWGSAGFHDRIRHLLRSAGMHPFPQTLQFFIVAVAGWINQQQRDVIDYLQEENRILCEQLGPRRLQFTDAQRRRLAALVHESRVKRREADETGWMKSRVHHLPLRQAEGFLTSLFGLMGLDLRSPDHTTLSRRGQHLELPLRGVPRRAGLQLISDSTGLSIVGEGEWAAAKHGGRGTRGWKKLYVGVDPTGVIVAHALTDATVDDATTGVELIEAVNDDITRVTADPAYDTVGFYEAAGARGARVVVPPTKTARVSRRRPRSRARDRPITQVKRSAGAGGSRRHATISKRASRTRSSGISRSSARGFALGHRAGERSKRCSGAIF